MHRWDIKSLVLDVKPTGRHFFVKLRIFILPLFDWTDVISLAHIKFIVFRLFALNDNDLVLDNFFYVDFFKASIVSLRNLGIKLGLEELVLFLHHVRFWLCLWKIELFPLLQRRFVLDNLWSLLSSIQDFFGFDFLAELTRWSFVENWIRYRQIRNFVAWRLVNLSQNIIGWLLDFYGFR